MHFTIKILTRDCVLKCFPNFFSSKNHAFLGEMAELTTKLACAAEGERRAKEQLEIRKDERNTEVTDLQNEVSWFRGEYDQLLLKVNFDPFKVIWGQ